MMFLSFDDGGKYRKTLLKWKEEIDAMKPGKEKDEKLKTFNQQWKEHSSFVRSSNILVVVANLAIITGIACLIHLTASVVVTKKMQHHQEVQQQKLEKETDNNSNATLLNHHENASRECFLSVAQLYEHLLLVGPARHDNHLFADHYETYEEINSCSCGTCHIKVTILPQGVTF